MRVRSVDWRIEWRRGLAGLSAILGRCKEWVDARCSCEVERGEFAGVDGALATGNRIFFADAEVVGRADLAADADVVGNVVAVVFFAFYFVAGRGARVGAAVAVGTRQTDAERPLVAYMFACGFAIAKECRYR